MLSSYRVGQKYKKVRNRILAKSGVHVPSLIKQKKDMPLGRTVMYCTHAPPPSSPSDNKAIMVISLSSLLIFLLSV